VPKPRCLPPNVEPLAVCREEAADIWGVGTTTFDELVKEGIIDPPIHVRGRRLWDLAALKRAWRRFADASAKPNNPWDER
jgi:hypothetical protein